ncbi:unnamed protein product [Oppiella nova]|uniref:Sulfatase N-terminal domain-containing protein n=1 Tax=Oppiella nova TaxID=334625 RepID=A0A7R9M6T1_9ACAR|nr:unnamed protein product [Oppiella nova]CAG2171308.1 unnamed protein product [Oppiella nova]
MMIKFNLFNLILLSYTITCMGGKRSAPPNVIVFMTDDMGWADVGYHSDHVLTPNIDTLAADGIILNQYYTQPLCSPSRGALLTGVHPIHTGLQNCVILDTQPIGLPLHFKLWPQYLKQYDYATHIVGKWHLGHMQREHTPTYRGFDSHVGFWSAYETYFNHTNCDFRNRCGLDFRHNMDLITNASGVYSTHYFTDRCRHVIDNHNQSKPLFLYMPYQSLHSAALNRTLEAPQEYIDKFGHIESDYRRRLAAMAYAMDESIGDIVERLNANNMLENSIIIFITDNGGDPVHLFGNGGLNWPLRGSKVHLFEGGVRVPAFIWSPLLNKSGYVSDAMIHVTDLLPTVLDAINSTGIHDEANIYGVSQWSTLSNQKRPVRWEIIHNVDPVWNMSAIRWYDWKLVQSPIPPYRVDGDSRTHFAYQGGISIDTQTYWALQMSDRLSCKASKVLSLMGRRADYNVLQGSVVECPEPPLPGEVATCDRSLCLFNVRDDPCERRDLLAETEPEFVDFLWSKLVEFNRTAVPPLSLVPLDPKGDPRLHNNSWINWLDNDVDMGADGQY